MRCVDIETLSEMENLQIASVFAMNQLWREGQTFVMKNPRPTSAVVWFCGGSGTYRSADGNVLQVKRGEVIYIPAGAQYECRYYNCEIRPTTLLVEFNLTDGEPFALSGGIRVIDTDTQDGRISTLLQKIVKEYSLPSKPMLKLRRDLFGLLSLICEAEQYKQIDRRGLKTIKAGIEYLQRDENQRLSVDEIAKECFVTPAYFRRLFKEYTGHSPSEYRTLRRMERAKDFLERADVSVEEVSAMLGYDDPAYFCRVFKKTVGISPLSYQKKQKLSEEE